MRLFFRLIINAIVFFAIMAPNASAVVPVQPPISVSAPIQRVRLHPDEAWVTRVGNARIQFAGTHRFLVSDLPPGLGIQDIRISAKSPQGTRLGDFSIGIEARKVTESPDYLAIKKERDALQDHIDSLESSIEAHRQEISFLNEFRAAYDKDVSAKLAAGAISGASIIDVSKSLSDRLTAISAKVRSWLRELGVTREEINRLNTKMRQMASERSASPSRAIVEITTPSPGNVEIELTYRTRQAKWTPAYEGRLAADEKKLELTLFASVRQSSGEDWGNVKLEITNARASRSLELPRLSGAQVITWSDAPPPPPPPPARIAELSERAYKSVAQNIYIAPDLDMEESADAAMDEAAPAEAASIEEIKGLATTWALDGAKDVPSDGEPHRFRVVSTEIAPALALVAIPRLDPTVFRVARFPLPGGIPLFPNAPMVHFAGTQRIGESLLALPAAGQLIQLGFGPYRGIRVALSRIDAKKENIGTFSKEIQWTLQERFDISNDLNEGVAVEIQDRELRAGNDKVKIIFQPEVQPTNDKQLPGINCWKFDLKPNSTVNMPFTYQIRIPQGFGRTRGIENLNLPN
jgi:uncharacterized protein (TIGR02231 family)